MPKSKSKMMKRLRKHRRDVLGLVEFHLSTGDNGNWVTPIHRDALNVYYAKLLKYK